MKHLKKVLPALAIICAAGLALGSSTSDYVCVSIIDENGQEFGRTCFAIAELGPECNTNNRGIACELFEGTPVYDTFVGAQTDNDSDIKRRQL